MMEEIHNVACCAQQPSNDISDNNIPPKTTTDLLVTTRNEPVLTADGLTATTSLEMHANDTHGKTSEINHGNG